MKEELYYSGDWIWEHKPHLNHETGEYEGEYMFSFVLGVRGTGKSVGFCLHAIEDFIKYGDRILVVDRFKKNIESKTNGTLENFCMKGWLLSPYSEGHELTFENHRAYIDGELFAYSAALNDGKSNDNKKLVFENVHTIIYDEFIPERGGTLPDEVRSMYVLIDTVLRNRDDAKKTTGVIMMANNITYANDFLVEFGVDRLIRPDTKRICRPEQGWVFERAVAKITEERYSADDPWGKILLAGPVGREYKGYAAEGSVNDNMAFVEPKMAGTKTYRCNFTYDDKIYALVYCNDSDLWYFTDNGVNPKYPRNYALTKEDHTTNTALITGIMRRDFAFYRDAFAAGRFRFNSVRTKKVFLDILRYL